MVLECLVETQTIDEGIQRLGDNGGVIRLLTSPPSKSRLKGPGNCWLLESDDAHAGLYAGYLLTVDQMQAVLPGIYPLVLGFNKEDDLLSTTLISCPGRCVLCDDEDGGRCGGRVADREIFKLACTSHRIIIARMKFYVLIGMIEIAFLGQTRSIPPHLLRSRLAPPSTTTFSFHALLVLCGLPSPPATCASCRRLTNPTILDSKTSLCGLPDCNNNTSAAPSWRIPLVESRNTVTSELQGEMLPSTLTTVTCLDAKAHQLLKTLHSGSPDRRELEDMAVPRASSVTEQVVRIVPHDPDIAKKLCLEPLSARSTPDPLMPDLSSSEDEGESSARRRRRRKARRKVVPSQDGSKTQTFLKTRMCVQYKNGKCDRGDECKFAHSYAELRATDDVYKTKLCSFFAAGHCRAGETCRHAHGEKDLRMMKQEQIQSPAPGVSSHVLYSNPPPVSYFPVNEYYPYFPHWAASQPSTPPPSLMWLYLANHHH